MEITVGDGPICRARRAGRVCLRGQGALQRSHQGLAGGVYGREQGFEDVGGRVVCNGLLRRACQFGQAHRAYGGSGTFERVHGALRRLWLGGREVRARFFHCAALSGHEFAQQALIGRTFAEYTPPCCLPPITRSPPN